MVGELDLTIGDGDMPPHFARDRCTLSFLAEGDLPARLDVSCCDVPLS